MLCSPTGKGDHCSVPQLVMQQNLLQISFSENFSGPNSLFECQKILNSLFSIVQKFNVSYRRLSRNFLLPSNVSKRLLQEFVEKHGNGFEVVYTSSGWLKNNPSVYHIRLVSGPKLSGMTKPIRRSDNDCCHSCEDVREAYRKKGWAISNPDMIDQNLIEKQSAHSTPKLKVILMSATVDSDLFSRYFGRCPVITAQGRTHPVSTHFLEDIYESINYLLALDSSTYLRDDTSTKKNDPVSNYRGKKNLVLSGWGDESILSEDFINPYYIPF
ncbi:hypothetical protein LOK49_LG12G02841 [Camellia lanceoleosa]|uniref:Uncharacterized protein n=1 Tax=Camellia lanceoleosa TaxID=1840588 RepID=A0ACC0FQT3_9ERIC|nr:hypothetical protein LOK49_LG12G02841 [Camellia lanceoleosa]